MGKTALGREIERIRKQRGISQSALGRTVGVSNVAIFLTERGETILGDDTIKRVAQALGVDPLPLLEMAAIERGTLSIKQVPESVQRLLCRMAHGETPSVATAAKLAAILDQEPIAA